MSDGAGGEILISVVVVHYRVPRLLRECLLSLRASRLDGTIETIVVDNNSGDWSHAMVAAEFPEVHWIALKTNIGFGKACNVGVRAAHGRYVLLLNPDTVVREDTLAVCVAFMESHPAAGLMGPKILNPDGTLQVSCRRSFPTPLVAFYRLSGLSRLFPRSRRFGHYNLTYLDPDQSVRVDAVSGSFMFMPRQLYLEIGGFDERFFMYGEDLDLCQRVHEHGREVWYHPGTQIVHWKGRSSAQRPLRSRAAFYEAMILFSQKYRHRHEAFLPGWLVLLGVLIQAAGNMCISLMRASTALMVDLLIINVTLWAGVSLRFAVSHRPPPYAGGAPIVSLMVGLHVLLSAVVVVTLWQRGVYSRSRYSWRNASMSTLFAGAVTMAVVYFVQEVAFSRIAFAGSILAVALLLPLWRALAGRVRHAIYATGTVVVLGSGEVARRLIASVENDRSARLVGVIWPEDNAPGEILGYPVLGVMSRLRTVLETHRVDVLLIATLRPWYSDVIEGLASSRVRHLSIRWVPREILERSAEGLPEQIPLHDFTM